MQKNDEIERDKKQEKQMKDKKNRDKLKDGETKTFQQKNVQQRTIQQRNFQRVLAMHDLSGLGRSSLMAITPVLSVMGIQVCPVPTAVLSTQTSGFSNYTFVDLTDTIPAYIAHWKQLQMDFDCIYSGFLGSAEQISIMEEILCDFSETASHNHTLVVIDPVLGDDNVRYDTIDEKMVLQMRNLIGHADIITPNETEVKLLLDLPTEQTLYAEQMEPYMKQLVALGPKTVVVTGMRKQSGGHCVCYYQQKRNMTACTQLEFVDYQELPVRYPGTGDIFTAVLIGGLLHGDDLKTSIQRSADFISRTVADAILTNAPVRDGVQLEKNLYRLL